MELISYDRICILVSNQANLLRHNETTAVVGGCGASMGPTWVMVRDRGCVTCMGGGGGENVIPSEGKCTSCGPSFISMYLLRETPMNRLLVLKNAE